MVIDLTTLSVRKAHEDLKSGVYTVRQLVDAYLAEIKNKNTELNAYLSLYTDIDAQVDAAQKRFTDGTATLLTGIPCAVKANLQVQGQTLNCGSKILEHYQSTYDATVITNFKKEGVILMGLTNMDEFAMGSSGENSAFGPTRNPLDLERTPGGSSAGSAAAVAGNLALIALGTDTGGSVRQPAALCGIAGMKPTYGAVSRYGAAAMGSSLDQISPFAKTADELQIMFEVMKGHDIHDMTSLPNEVWEKEVTKKTYKIAVPENFLEGINPDVRKNLDESIKALAEMGHSVDMVSIPALKYALPVYYILMPAEVSSNLARYDGIRYGSVVSGDSLLDTYKNTRSQLFGTEVKRRIIIGTYVLSAGYADQYYERALALREKIKQELQDIFVSYDFILTPTAPNPAFKIGEKIDDPLTLYLEDIYTVSANITGFPAISVPSGFVAVEGRNLPVGIQFMGPHGSDRAVLDMAQKFEQG